MALSTSGLLSNIWLRMFWAFCLYLALELGLFVIVKQVLRTTPRELIGPYLAYAAPAAIILPLAWWLKSWEVHGPSPRRLALGWGACGLFFSSAVIAAFFYSGVELHLLNPKDVWMFTIVGVASVLIASFSLYRVALSRISTRAARKTDGP